MANYIDWDTRNHTWLLDATRGVNSDHDVDITVGAGNTYNVVDNNNGEGVNEYRVTLEDNATLNLSHLDANDQVHVQGEGWSIQGDENPNDGKITLVNSETGATLNVSGSHGQSDEDVLGLVNFQQGSISYQNPADDPANPVNSAEWDKLSLKGKIFLLLFYLIDKIEDAIDREAQALVDKGDNFTDVDALEFDKQTQLRTTIFNLFRTIIDNLTATESSAVQSVAAR